ncbi:MAG TPA: hypothetical protein DEA26_07735, partial [Oceanospirillales bacterium]|nr:hypothetical protein [Oceanospirillales bacterium]
QCDDQTVHMEAGSVWTFDNWRPHQVNNHSDITRIHLVADTTGNSKLLGSLDDCTVGKAALRKNSDYHSLSWNEQAPALPLKTERGKIHTVMAASEVELLAGNYLRDLPTADTPAVHQWKTLLTRLIQDWQELWSQYRDAPESWTAYRQLRDQVFSGLQAVGESVPLQSNGIDAILAVKSGLISYLLQGEADKASAAGSRAGAATPPAKQPLLSLRLPRPVFIVAAPRSGSTLLFETLAVSPELWTLGGEAHWLIEQFPDWQPETGAVDSNRLDASALTQARGQALLQSVAQRLRNHKGEKLSGHANVRWLEKTPKNALRIPLLKALFPDALFVHLWRSPEENIASIMNAWNKGNWVTYPSLPGRKGPWSLLLPPGWQALNGRPLPEIAAFQWEATNRIILEDLKKIHPSQQLRISYSDLCQNPGGTVQKILSFSGLSMTSELQERCGHNLPPSRYTDTLPEAGKWRRYETEILRVLPSTQAIYDRLSQQP